MCSADAAPAVLPVARRASTSSRSRTSSCGRGQSGAGLAMRFIHTSYHDNALDARPGTPQVVVRRQPMKLYFSPLACSLATRIACYEASAELSFVEVDL